MSIASITRGLGLVSLGLLLGSDARAQLSGRYEVPVEVSEPRGLALGDFDGDGNVDVVYVAGAVGGDVWWMPTLGAGRPGVPTRVGAGVATTSWIRAGDLDGDNDLDLVMGGVRAPGTGVVLPNPPIPLPPLPPAPFDRILVGTNDGTATFAWTYHRLPFHGTGIDGRLGRADADGDLDLFLLTESGISVLLNDGAGNLLHAGSYPKTDPALFPPAGPGAIVADVTTRLDVGDFNGDGVDDVAVVNNRIRVVDFTQFPFLQDHPLDLVTVHVNDGAGALSIGPQVPTGHDAKRIVAVDFDGDALADFAVSRPGNLPSQGPTPDPGGLEVFLNAGLGSFVGTPHASNFNPGGLLAGDFDADGTTDLATIGSTHYLTFPPPPGYQVELTLHANDGAGGFAAGTPHGRVTATLFPQVDDVDGDGLLDLLAVSDINGFTEIRFMNSMPRSFALEPGTGDDLILETAVNGGVPTGTPPEDVKTLGPGDPWTGAVTTPQGGFVSAPLFVFVGFGIFDWAANPVPGSHQLLNFPLWSIMALAPMPASGTASFSARAPQLPGFSFFVQFAALGPAAGNGAYATTDGHILLVR
jgi:hypothetical protein